MTMNALGSEVSQRLLSNALRVLQKIFDACQRSLRKTQAQDVWPLVECDQPARKAKSSAADQALRCSA
jgi:hypothetical protein